MHERKNSPKKLIAALPPGELTLGFSLSEEVAGSWFPNLDGKGVRRTASAEFCERQLQQGSSDYWVYSARRQGCLYGSVVWVGWPMKFKPGQMGGEVDPEPVMADYETFIGENYEDYVGRFINNDSTLTRLLRSQTIR